MTGGTEAIDSSTGGAEVKGLLVEGKGEDEDTEPEDVETEDVETEDVEAEDVGEEDMWKWKAQRKNARRKCSSRCNIFAPNTFTLHVVCYRGRSLGLTSMNSEYGRSCVALSRRMTSTRTRGSFDPP